MTTPIVSQSVSIPPASVPGRAAAPGIADVQRIAVRWLAPTAIVLYAWFYLGASIPAFGSANARFADRFGHHLAILSSPHVWIHSWCGGDWSRFALLDRIPVLAMAAFLLLCAWAAGRIIWRWTPGRNLWNRAEGNLFSIAIGLHLLSLFTLVLGLCGALHLRIATWGLLLATVLVELWLTARETHRTSIRQSLAHFVVEFRNQRGLLFSSVLAMPFIAWLFLAACLPPWHFDTRVYHLQVPKEWFQQGAITFLPHNVYGNMPLGAEMHSLLAMVLWPGDDAWWWGALAGKVVMAIYTPITAIAIGLMGRRYFSTTAGCSAAALYLATPWVTFVATNGLNEPASSLYWLLTAFSIWRWYEQKTAPSDPTDIWPSSYATATHLLVPGFMAGAAVSCKYTAVPFVVLPLLLFVAVASWQSRSKTSQFWFSSKTATFCVLVCSLSVIVSCGTWLGKNWILTGNPTYPLLYGIFGGETRSAEKDLQWRTAHAPPIDSAGHRFSAHQFVDAIQRFLGRSSGASPLIFPLGLVAVIASRRSRLTWWLLVWVAFVLTFWWLATHRFDRFWVPLLPVMALLAGVGAATLMSISTNARRWLTVCVLLGVGSNFFVTTSRTLGDNRIFVALEDLRLDLPRATDQYFSRINPAHRFLNHLVPADGSVLLVGDIRPFDLEVPAHYNTCFDDCLFETLLKDKTPAEQRATLAAHRITHVLVSWSDIDCWRMPGEYGFSPWVSRTRVRQQLAGEDRVLRKLDCGLPDDFAEIYAVVPESAADVTPREYPNE